jgi:hypothetical protein
MCEICKASGKKESVQERCVERRVRVGCIEVQCRSEREREE